MSKLPTIEIINLIAAIEDSILLKWKRQSNANERIQFLRRCELPPPNNLQGTLQVLDRMLALSEDPECMKLLAEMPENLEHESKK